ncbi:MAG: hypothetical protein J07HR59_01510 [Halorubrum sp. J07HR59]|nr:MAG: hypothetical protein J07HR59_01510 [Halorubrum sp. J07HR59]
MRWIPGGRGTDAGDICSDGRGDICAVNEGDGSGAGRWLAFTTRQIAQQDDFF